MFPNTCVSNYEAEVRALPQKLLKEKITLPALFNNTLIQHGVYHTYIRH
jgi:hypothetical protein